MITLSELLDGAGYDIDQVVLGLPFIHVFILFHSLKKLLVRYYFKLINKSKLLMRGSVSKELRSNLNELEKNKSYKFNDSNNVFRQSNKIYS